MDDGVDLHGVFVQSVKSSPLWEDASLWVHAWHQTGSFPKRKAQDLANKPKAQTRLLVPLCSLQTVHMYPVVG